MSQIGRRVRAVVNPVSTAATGWWCHSAWRHMLTGHGSTATRRRLIRRRMIQGASRMPAAEQNEGACGSDRAVCFSETTS